MLGDSLPPTGPQARVSVQDQQPRLAGGVNAGGDLRPSATRGSHDARPQGIRDVHGAITAAPINNDDFLARPKGRKGRGQASSSIQGGNDD